jgi:hypothetical protein
MGNFFNKNVNKEKSKDTKENKSDKIEILSEKNDTTELSIPNKLHKYIVGNLNSKTIFRSRWQYHKNHIK